MATQTGTYPRFSFGKTVSDMFGVIGRRYLLLSGLALLLYGLPAAIFMAFLMDGFSALIPDLANIEEGETLNLNWLGSFGTAAIASWIGTILISIYTQSAMIWAVSEDINDEHPTFGGALRGGFRFFLPVLGITLIYYLLLGGMIALPVFLAFGAGAGAGVIVLLFLVVIPAILFLFVALLVAVPASIAELCGPIAAIGRSWSLTAGHRWKLFAMLLIYGFAAMIISSAISGATMPLMMMGDVDPSSPFEGMTLVIAIQSFLGALMLVFTYPAIVATYHNLRIAKEGVRHESVTDIFE